MGTQKLTTLKTLKHIIIYFLLFLAGDFGSSLIFDLLFRVVKLPVRELYYILRSLGGFALTFLFFYLYTAKALHLSMRDFRIDFAVKKWGICLALLLPAFVVMCVLPIGKLTVNRVTFGQSAFIVISSLLMALKAGILEEMLFRGYIMRLIENRWNKYAAILLPSFLFSLAHIPSMEFFSMGGVLLLVVSGTLVGTMFSLAVYKGNSISNSVLLHAVWNFVIVSDVLHITTVDGAYGHPIFSVIIPSDNILLTGAGFGVEASIIASLGYFLVCCWIILWKKK